MRFIDTVISGLFGRTLDHPLPYNPSILENQSDSTSTLSSSPQLSITSSFSTSPISDLSMSSQRFWQPRLIISSAKWFQIRPIKYRFPISKRQIAALITLLLMAIFWFAPPPQAWVRRRTAALKEGLTLRPGSIIPSRERAPDPLKWLQENSRDRHAKCGTGDSLFNPSKLSKRPRAALISLVRNSELSGLIQSMRQLEYHWNHKYQYPWIFFNDEPFSDEFKVFLCGRGTDAHL